MFIKELFLLLYVARTLISSFRQLVQEGKRTLKLRKFAAKILSIYLVNFV